jgi:hypothetical protein
MPVFHPPTADEHAPYYSTYTQLVPEGDVLDLLAAQLDELPTLLARAAGRGAHRYAPGKWSITEVLGHMADSERVFAYRALAFARGAADPIPGMEQDEWMADAGFAARSLDDVGAELAAVRRATLALYRTFDATAAARRGTASGSSFTVNALVHVTAGHWAHHRRVLDERYGLAG